jgi:DNA-binding HxlR family transcriptional regulator
MDMRSTVAKRFAGQQEGTSKFPRSGIAPARGDTYRERAACPLYTAIGVIEGRWKPMIFQRLASRPHGFGELRRAMPDVSAKVLREQLRQMQADGLVARQPLTPARLGVRYRVTAYGQTLGPVFGALWQWGMRHVARRDADRGTLVAPPRTRPATR